MSSELLLILYNQGCRAIDITSVVLVARGPS